MRLGRQLFQVAPEDRGPIRAGEEEALLAFTEEQLPPVHRALTRLRDRDPERYRVRLEQEAPRLRHLRRLFKRSPRMGAIVRDHAQSMFRLRRVQHRLAREAKGTPMYDSALQAARERLAQTVEFEREALEVLGDVLVEERPDRIAKRVEYLLSPGADLARVPEPLRELVGQHAAAEPDSDERAAARSEFGRVVARQVDREIAALRRQIERMDDEKVQEVDRRMERLLRDVDRLRRDLERERHQRGRRHRR
jgi:hypothetical protein